MRSCLLPDILRKIKQNVCLGYAPCGRRPSITGEELHADVFIAADSQHVEGRVEDIVAMCSAVHERLMHGPGRAFSSDKIFPRAPETVAHRNQAPRRILPRFGIPMAELPAFRHPFRPLMGHPGQTIIPVQLSILALSQSEELVLRTRLDWLHSGLTLSHHRKWWRRSPDLSVNRPPTGGHQQQPHGCKALQHPTHTTKAHPDDHCFRSFSLLEQGHPVGLSIAHGGGA